MLAKCFYRKERGLIILSGREDVDDNMRIEEEQLLDLALDIMEESGALEAYRYILSHKSNLRSYGSQLYNYLYCLGALAGLKTEALEWMKEAIEVKRYWYRPTVFEDSDLDSLRSESIFQKCREISEKRYYKELENAKTVCTWDSVKSKKLALVLHGNQQNIQMCQKHWEALKGQGYQVEYVQSKTLDSYNLYRWDDEETIQLEQVVKTIQWNKYDSRILCGFSAGCNEILKNILYAKMKCEGIILQSPWIPIIETNMTEILTFIHDNSIWMEIICGREDKDCLYLTEKFAASARERNIKVRVEWSEGVGHQYPSNFSEILDGIQ